MEHSPRDPSQGKGWGVDVDPKNDPTYPMKHRTDGEHAGYSWERPPQQQPTVEVLHVFAERGWSAEWQHNRQGLARRVFVQAGLVLAAVAYLRRKKAG